MAFQSSLLEFPEVSPEGAALLQDWGRLSRLDESDPAVGERYRESLQTAKALGDKSLTAAALVEADANSSSTNIASKLSVAKDIVKTVKSWSKQFTGKNDDVALVIDSNNTFAVVNANSVEPMRLGYRAEPNRQYQTGAWVHLHARDMTYATAHNGKLGMVQQSYYDPASKSGGGSMALVVPLYEAAVGHDTNMIGYRLPPVTLGRLAIGELFAKTAEYESHESVTEHRHRTVSYALWRIRGQDESLSASIDEAVSEFGLDEIWKKQHRTETAAKVAHALRAGITDDKQDELVLPLSFRRYEWPGERESELLPSTDAEVLEAIQEQCGRLGVTGTGVEIEAALRYVTKPGFPF